MNDLAVMLNPNLSGDQVLGILEQRVERDARLMDQIREEVLDSPATAEGFLVITAENPMLSPLVRTYAATVLVAVRARRHHQEAK